MLFDFAALGMAERYKLLVSTVVPRPIAWVVSQDAAGQLNAAPYSFFNAFCHEPPIVCIGIGIKPQGERKDTARNIRDTGEFVVNLVAAGNADQMNVTAIEFGHDVNELAEAGLTTLPSVKVRPPRIAESPVSLECETFKIVDLTDDRVIVMGRVLAMHVRDEAVMDPVKCYIDTPKLDLIGRMHGRGWYSRTTDRFDVPRIQEKDWTRRG